MPIPKIFFCSEPAERIEKHADEDRLVVRGRINNVFFGAEDLMVGKTVDWAGHAFIITYTGQICTAARSGNVLRDIEMIAIIPKNSHYPANAKAIENIIEETKATKALKRAKLKENGKRKKKIEERKRAKGNRKSSQKTSIYNRMFGTMNDYVDLSCMALDDEKYSKNKKNGFSSQLILSCNVQMPCRCGRMKCCAIRKNMPIVYEDGIFRIESISYEGWNIRVKIFGDFSEKDPNGHALNGWTNDEMSNSSSQDFTSAVDSLEV